MRLILLLVCLFLSGCGQKGDLYLPEPSTAEAEDTAAAESDDNEDEET